MDHGKHNYFPFLMISGGHFPPGMLPGGLPAMSGADLANSLLASNMSSMYGRNMMPPFGSPGLGGLGVPFGAPAHQGANKP